MDLENVIITYMTIYIDSYNQNLAYKQGGAI